MTISAKNCRERGERVEADDHGRPGQTENGAGKFQQRGGLVPRIAQVIRNGKSASSRPAPRSDAGTYCCAQAMSRNGTFRFDGLLLREQLPGLAVRRHPHSAYAQDDEQEGRGDQRALRDESDRRGSNRARLGQRIGRAPAARQREQQRIVAPAATDFGVSGGNGACACGFFHFTRLMVPEKVNSDRSPDFSTPRRKISEPPARVISPSH